MSTKAFRELCGVNAPEYYVQFRGGALSVRKALEDIKEQYGLSSGNIKQNTIIMAAMGLSENQYMQTFYSTAAVLFVLILAAGVLMISGSMNSNVAQRSQFFGMLRCIGAGRKQIIRFVRLEALNWCKLAIPTGAVLGTVVSWALCAVLHYLVGGEVADIPIFNVSPVGIVSGIVVGLLTVLLAAQAPAKRAAKVSPVAAVQGSEENKKNIRRAANTGLMKIETALGAHHAMAAKKNLLLMTGSFALSIILFLCFSVLVELVGYLLPQKSYAPDLEITSKDLSNSVDSSLLDEISALPGVKQTVGRKYVYDVPAELGREMAESNVDIISYDEVQLGWLPEDKDLRKGSDIAKVYGDSNYVLTIYDKDVPLKYGDKIQIGTAELEIAGMLKYSPFSNDGRTGGEVIIICSEETFSRLTGVNGYAIIEAQLAKDAPESTVRSVRRMADGKYNFRDRRDEADQSIYRAFMLFVYGFLAIIAMITVLNIVNSVSMSVSSRMKQYGAMRAIGMSTRQLTKMIAAEAVTYAVSGCVVGCGVGLPLNKLMYDFLITSHFDYFTWSVPVLPIAIILLFVAFASAAAVYAPAKRIRDMSIVGTIHAE
ncbi:MAG: FtsX-like permease family protein [Oscillospiraceae bacterium]|nr:FtsX-like permease family protein [Oscillospiraceae bacterium]